MHQNMQFEAQKLKKKSGQEELHPLPRHLLQWGGGYSLPMGGDILPPLIQKRQDRTKVITTD